MSKRAVLVGINYKNTGAELRGCIEDTHNIRDFLIKYCGYRKENVVVLTEEDGEIPTRRNIELRIRWLVKDAKAGDVLFFQYSGHGTFVNDTSSDESDRRDEVIIPLDYSTRGVITDDQLFDTLVSRVPEGATLWSIIDCCHAGTIFDLKYNYKYTGKYESGNIRRDMPFVSREWSNQYSFSIEPSKSVKGKICLFTGSMDDEKATDAYIERKFQRAFTYCLLK